MLLVITYNIGENYARLSLTIYVQFLLEGSHWISIAKSIKLNVIYGAF